MKQLVGIMVAVVVVLMLVFFLARKTAEAPALLPSPPSQESTATAPHTMRFSITSGAFTHNGSIPPLYTCDGKNISPRLDITGIPADAKSLVLIMHDPDAPVSDGWTHWVVYHIPPLTRVIEEGKAPEGVSGKNSWGRTGYGGPCPPSGTHRYFFTLYALNTPLSLPEGSGKNEVRQAMQGHILAQTELVGLYARNERSG